MATCDLYLLRHGKRDDPPLFNQPLNNDGLSQAKELINTIKKNFIPDYIYC